MEHSDELRYVALARFDRAYLQPSLSGYSSLFRHGKLSTALENYYLADLLEGYLWLGLGVTLGVFPIDAARELVRQRLAIIFPKLPAFLSSWGYVFSSGMDDLVLTAINQNEFFLESKLAPFKVPQQLASSFQSAWLLETRFARDPYASGFVTALNFRYEELVQQTASASIFSSRSRFAEFEEDIHVPVGSIAQGSLRVMQHLSEFGFFFAHLQDSQFIIFDDRVLFRQDLKQICGWRVDYGGQRAHMALLSLVDSLAIDVPAELIRHLDLHSITTDLRIQLANWRLDSAESLSA